MAYYPPYADQWGTLAPEEFEVQEALLRAGYAYDEGALTSWAPTGVLHRVYRQYVAGLQHRANDYEAPTTLSVRQFGAALRRVWPLEADDCFLKTWHGKRMWGYIRITGPEAITFIDGRIGRKKVSDVEPT